MEDILRIAAVAVIATLCITLTKKSVPEIALVLTLTAGVLILLFAADAVWSVKELADTLAERAGLSDEVVSAVVKTVAIAIITRLAAAVCRDAGEGGLAAFTEVAGTAMVLLVLLPLLELVLEMMAGLLE